VFSSTKLVIRAEQKIPETEGEVRGAGGRNDPNNVSTCE
jgi:hypothetical protein